MTWFKKLLCFFKGHSCEPTGRHAVQLREWKCQRCGGLYVSNEPEYGDMLLPSDGDFVKLFEDYRDMLKRHAKLEEARK
jgi:hypothetical protein